MQVENRKRVVIIGGGLSGLTVANDILDKQSQSDITVIEAMDRVGGRTCSVKMEGVVYQMGAQWIGPGQDLVKQLAIKAGNQFYPQYTNGRKVMQFGKSIQTYNSDIPKNVGIFGLIELQLAIWKIDRMARKVPFEDPSLCENAIQWDSQTLASWIHKTFWIERVKVLLEVSCRAVFCCQTNEVSLLFFLWYIHQNGGVQRVINIKNGLQEIKMLKGTQSMSEYLNQQIQQKGGKVLINTFVNKIENLQEKCVVYSSCGKKFEADYVVIALPPANVKKIRFFPELSSNRKVICNKHLLGQCTKFVVLYKQPYWRKNGFSGEVLGDCIDSPLFMAYDDSRPKQNGQMQYGMVVFITAGILREWLWREDWQQKVLDQLAKVFNCEQMKKPISSQYKNWDADPSVEGSYAGYYPPGALTQIKDLRQPEGRIHWAGTELALKSQGYMEGAIISGQRVAKQILTRFKDHNDIPKSKERPIRKQGFYYNQTMQGKL